MNIGTLYVVATPIGNLEDISLRALRILSEVDFILCEDTRVTRKLLKKYEIEKSLLSYHQHSQLSKIEKIIDLLGEGKNLALLTDAGTPGISDPGFSLIEAIRLKYENLAKIVPIPGPSALTAALSVSAWPISRFSFFGFLPHKKGRQKMLKEMLLLDYPVVFYESKHRLSKCLKELSLLSEQENLKIEIMLAREITKVFESFYFGAPEDILLKLENNPDMKKGEFVIAFRKLR